VGILSARCETLPGAEFFLNPTTNVWENNGLIISGLAGFIVRGLVTRLQTGHDGANRWSFEGLGVPIITLLSAWWSAANSDRPRVQQTLTCSPD